MKVNVTRLETVTLDNHTSKWCQLPYHTSKWCQLPYPRHPKGCPNFGREGCPPLTKNFHEILTKPYYLIGVRFDLKSHVESMKSKHPKWSDAQAYCVLYWQSKVNKKLREVAEKFSSQIPNSKILYRPEAHGVHVFKTCENIGLRLERNPQHFVWKIAIIGKEIN